MTETASSAVPETSQASTDHRSAYGFGVATVSTADASVLDVWFPAPALGVAAENLRSVENADESLRRIAENGADQDRGTEQKVVTHNNYGSGRHTVVLADRIHLWADNGRAGDDKTDNAYDVVEILSREVVAEPAA